MGLPVRNAQKNQDFEMLTNLEVCHGISICLWAVIHKLDKERRRRTLSTRVMSEDEINMEAVPGTSIPDKFSSTSSSNL